MAKNRTSNKGRRFPAEILTSAEAINLLKACNARCPSGARNRAILTLGYRAGLRVSEVLRLAKKDIDLAGGLIRVLNGKGGKSRTVPLDFATCATVERWVNRRKALGLGRRRRLFCTLKGGPILSGYIRALMPRLARKAGIEKRCHFHVLRHSFAAELSAEGVPVAEIQALLGHSSLATTSRYVAHLAPAELIKRIHNRPVWNPDQPEPDRTDDQKRQAEVAELREAIAALGMRLHRLA